MNKTLALLCFCHCVLVTIAHAGGVVVPGSWYSRAWNDDDTSGIGSNTVWAYNLGSGTTAEFDSDVDATGVATTTVSIADRLTIAGTANVFPFDGNALNDNRTDGSATMASQFIYGGFPTNVTLAGLTPGQRYTVTLFTVGWDGDSTPAFRTLTFASGADSLTTTQDQFGKDKGVRFEYLFTATAPTRLITISVANPNSASFHFYGIALRTSAPPSTVVTNTEDAGEGSLRQAILDAAPDASITFAPGLAGQVITLRSGELAIAKNLSIDASALTKPVTVDAGGTSRVFYVTGPGVQVTMNNLGVTGGSAPGGGGGCCVDTAATLIMNDCRIWGNASTHASTYGGGGLYNNSATLRMNRCSVTDNRSQYLGGGVYGVGFDSVTTTVIKDSTLARNSAAVAGGGFLNDSVGPPTTMTLENCTIANNQAVFYCGAGRCGNYSNAGPATLNLTHCSIVGNTAGANFGGMENFANSGPAVTNISYSIIADNQSPTIRDLKNTGGTVNATGVNLIGSTTNSNVTWPAATLTGTDAAPLRSKLAPLGGYGGKTLTMPPLVGSPAIDSATGSALARDQRGYNRGVDGDGNASAGPDLGAAENGTVQVTTLADELNIPAGAAISLREAVSEAPPGTLITFAPALAGTIVLDPLLGTIKVQSSVLIDADFRTLTIQGQGTHSLFGLFDGASAGFNRLRFVGGGGYVGGAIDAVGAVTLSRCTLEGNQTTQYGGALYSTGPATLSQCTFTGNRSVIGGAVCISAALYDMAVIEQCTFSVNTATNYGGAIEFFSPGLVRYCTISGNDGADYGGGIDLTNAFAKVTLAYNIISGNTANYGPDVSNYRASVTREGVNIIPFYENDAGTDSGPAALTSNPLLLPLGYYGGPTQTMPPQQASPARNPSGGQTIAPFITDQRGSGRQIGSLLDLGAVELGSALVVTNLNNTGAGSLRAALASADAAAGADIITFQAGLAGTIALATELTAASDVMIDGRGAFVSISGNLVGRILRLSPGASVSLNQLTLLNGKPSGPIETSGGGAIWAENASVALTDCTISGSQGTTGGAIYASGASASVAVNRCTFQGNSASLSGGTITTHGTLLSTHSTFTGNSSAQGGAIMAANGGSATVRFCTIAGNTVSTAAAGSGIEGPLVLEYSVVAGNTGGSANVASTKLTQLGVNLTVGDPLLTPLADFGGLTQTMMPLPGSQAIDQAPPLASADSLDQRGQLRNVGLRPDLGAVEAAVITVTTAVDELDPIGTAGTGLSLREAVRDIPAGWTIAFDRAVFNGSTPTTNTIILTQGPLNPPRSCTLNGNPNPGGITIRTQFTITQQPQSQTGTLNQGGLIFTVTVQDISNGTAYQWRKDGVDLPGITNSILGLGFLTEDSEGVYDVALSELPAAGVLSLLNVTKPAGTGLSAPATLVVDGAPLTVKRNPAPAMLAVGSNHTLSVVAIGPETPALTYQWMKAGKPIKGATQRTYTITNAQLSHAGSYLCLVKSGLSTLPSAAADIGVVDARLKTVNLKTGQKFSIKVSAAGAGLSFEWFKNGSSSGAPGDTFILPAVSGGDTGFYTCRVTGTAGVFNGGALTRLNVSASAPLLLKPLSLPMAAIGQFYYYQIPVVFNVPAPATAFSIAGVLPAGITYDKVTGVISGRPTASKPGGYPLTIKAINGVNFDFATVTLFVGTIPPECVGVYAGAIARNALSDELGGRFDLTTTATGTFSGSVTLGIRKKVSFVSKLLHTAGAGDVILSAPITGLTKADGTPLLATVEFFAIDQTARLTLAVPNTISSVNTGWRKPWIISKNPALNRPATAYAAYYTGIAYLDTFFLDATKYPNGYGYTSFTVKPDGTLTLAGRLPDGNSITGGSFVSAQGDIVLFNLLHGNRGTHVGTLKVGADKALGGLTTWGKPAPLANSKDTVYKAGFAPTSVGFSGGVYSGIAKGALIMGLPMVAAGTVNAAVDFRDVNAAFSQSLNVSRKSANEIVNFITPVAPVTNSVKFTSLNTATGAFSGSFTIAGATAAKNRVAPFSGVLIDNVGGNQAFAAGYYLLPDAPTGTQTVTTSPKVSGSLYLYPFSPP